MNILKKIKRSIRLTRSKSIIRRYFIVNSFDGILTTLGIVIGSYYIKIQDPKTILATGVGGAVAIAVSGISSAYLSERAEKRSRLNKLEKAMLTPLRSSVLAEAAETSAWIAAFANGISPFTGSIIMLIPFLIMPTIILSYITSILLGLAMLFLLGIYLGRISKENTLFYGFKTFMTGIIVGVVLLFIRVFT